MQSILLQLETEGGNTNWDFSSLQGFSGDGIMLFYALLKSSYDSSGMKLTTPIASEISNPVLNFNDLAAFGGIVVPEKKAEKKAAVEPPPTPIVAVTSAEKLLSAVSAVNATDQNQEDLFNVLKLIINDSTSDRYRNYLCCYTIFSSCSTLCICTVQMIFLNRLYCIGTACQFIVLHKQRIFLELDEDFRRS